MRSGAYGRSFRGMKLRSPVLTAVIAVFIILSIGLFLYNFFWFTGAYQAKQAVRTFYEYEQAGDYGSSWEMLHPQMKQKFNKDRYIQKRTLIYMQELGATAFEIEIGDADRVEAWSMSTESPALTEVYRIPVEQKLMTIFGEWTIRQDVFAAEETEGWKLLWDYSKD